MERPNAWLDYTQEQLADLDRVCEGYKRFISDNKTEREVCAASIERARAAGYRDLKELVAQGVALKAGDKVYASNHGKGVLLVHLGTEPLESGLNILGAHIDSPRMDLKQNPLEEKNDLLTLDTHYYGGIKKYQWVTIPLAIHGVVAKKDGSIVNVCVGEDEGDPVFCVTDLLIHLSQEQLTKEASKVIDGEMLDVLCGGRPVVIEGDDAKKDNASGGQISLSGNGGKKTTLAITLKSNVSADTNESEEKASLLSGFASGEATGTAPTATVEGAVDLGADAGFGSSESSDSLPIWPFIGMAVAAAALIVVLLAKRGKGDEE